jgi:polygalacturonase
MGGGAAALFGAAQAEAASAPASGLGRSVAEFGVEPNSSRDQSAAMQKAINELAQAGLPILIPAGHYRLSSLQLPSNSAIIGVPQLTVLMPQAPAPVFEAANKQDIGLRGISFSGYALAAKQCRNVTITDCQILASEGDGFFVSGSGFFIANNRASGCAGSAIRAEGDGMITTNLVGKAGQFGIRAGGVNRLGNVTIINNMIDGAHAGIGVSAASDGYALITMNMIVGAKNGGIRALDGDQIIGKDLTKGGSEAFRNFAIAANVSI